MEMWKMLCFWLHPRQVQVARKHCDDRVAVLLQQLQGARIVVAVAGKTEALGERGLVPQGDQRDMAENHLGLVAVPGQHVAQPPVSLRSCLRAGGTAVVDGDEQDTAMLEGVVHPLPAESLAAGPEVLRRAFLLHDFMVAGDRIERTRQGPDDFLERLQVRSQPVQALAVDQVATPTTKSGRGPSVWELIASTTQRAFSLAFAYVCCRDDVTAGSLA